jgi:hypothetical protein
MESLKIREKNIILSRIREIENYIKRNKDTISRFKNQTNQSSFEIKQIEKITMANINYQKEIDELNKKIQDIITGKMNQELGNIIIESKQKLLKENEKQRIKNINKENKNESDKKLITKSFKINGNKNDEYYLNKEYERFIKICDSIPEYIERNLKEMPVNKGYIWKGLWCPGKLPADNTKQIIMFEKLYNGVLRIHEIDDEYKRIYEKKGKDKKNLIYEEPRSEFIKHYRKSTGGGNIFNL